MAEEPAGAFTTGDGLPSLAFSASLARLASLARRSSSPRFRVSSTAGLIALSDSGDGGTVAVGDWRLDGRRRG